MPGPETPIIESNPTSPELTPADVVMPEDLANSSVDSALPHMKGDAEETVVALTPGEAAYMKNQLRKEIYPQVAEDPKHETNTIRKNAEVAQALYRSGIHAIKRATVDEDKRQ